MSDLFLRVRVQSLQRTLRQVAALNSAVQASNNDVQELYRALAVTGSGFRIKLGRLIEFVNALHGASEFEEELAELLNMLGKLDELETAHQYAASLGAELREMTTMIKELKYGIDEIDNLLVGTAEVFPNMNEISRSLRTLEAGLPAPDTAATAGHWNQLGTIVAEARRSVFANYVDVAGGLSMRKAGLDGRVCMIADQLCRLWQVKTGDRFVTPAFSLPGRDEPRPGSTVVSLGFPEWTIWGLPLLEHDIGLLALTAEPDALEGLDATLAADAFGTFVMGPAYACAALLLRLDPAEAIDRERATVVLAALERLNDGRFQGALVTVRDTLRDAWATAAESLTTDAGNAEPAADPAAGETAPAAASLALNRAAALIDASTRTDDEYPMQITPADFSTATTLKGVLLGDIPAELPTISARDALNGAWLARLDNQNAERAERIEESIKRQLAPRAQQRPPRSDAPRERVAIRTGFNTARGGRT